MKPNKISEALLKIATKIDNSKQPDRDLLTTDLHFILAKLNKSGMDSFEKRYDQAIKEAWKIVDHCLKQLKQLKVNIDHDEDVEGEVETKLLDEIQFRIDRLEKASDTLNQSREDVKVIYSNYQKILDAVENNT